jgi:hypothetical protein
VQGQLKKGGQGFHLLYLLTFQNPIFAEHILEWKILVFLGHLVHFVVILWPFGTFPLILGKLYHENLATLIIQHVTTTLANDDDVTAKWHSLQLLAFQMFRSAEMTASLLKRRKSRQKIRGRSDGI